MTLRLLGVVPVAGKAPELTRLHHGAIGRFVAGNASGASMWLRGLSLGLQPAEPRATACGRMFELLPHFGRGRGVTPRVNRHDGGLSAVLAVLAA